MPNSLAPYQIINPIHNNTCSYNLKFALKAAKVAIYFVFNNINTIFTHQIF